MYFLKIISFCVLVTLNSQAAVVKIGHAANFGDVSTSAINPYNKAVSNGLEFAVEEHRNKLKAKNIEIEIMNFDYGSSEILSLKAARELVSSEVLAAIGFYESGQALLAAPELNKSGVPLISPVASATRLFKTGPYFYPMSFSNEDMGKALANFSKKSFNAKSALVVAAANCAYCTDLAKAFDGKASELGIKITRVDVLNEETGLEAVSETVLGKKFDVVVIPNHELTSARIIAHLQKLKVNGPFLGGDGWGNADGSGFFQIVNNPTFVGYTLAHWHPELSGSEGKKFANSWRSKFGKNPSTDSAMAYNSMSFLISGLLQAKTLSRKDVQAALSSIKRFRGVTGTLEFGSANTKPILILRSDAKKKVFSPMHTTGSRG